MREYLLPTRVVDGDKIENAETLLRSKGLYATINYNVEEWKDYLKMEGVCKSLHLKVLLGVVVITRLKHESF